MMIMMVTCMFFDFYDSGITHACFSFQIYIVLTAFYFYTHSEDLFLELSG
jgi:hypothetical protein